MYDMKLTVRGKLPDNPRNIMRRLGFGEHFDPNTKQISYSRRLSSGRFPRYHAYIEEIDGGMKINLHIDQKKASYTGQSAHSGEYEGPLVEQEIERIKSMISQMSL